MNRSLELSSNKTSPMQVTTERDYLSSLPEIVIKRKEKQRLIEVGRRRRLLKKSIRAMKNYDALKSKSYIYIFFYNLINDPSASFKTYLKGLFYFYYCLLLIPLKVIFYPLRSFLKLLRFYGFLEQVSRKEILLVILITSIFLLGGLVLSSTVNLEIKQEQLTWMMYQLREIQTELKNREFFMRNAIEDGCTAERLKQIYQASHPIIFFPDKI